MTDRVDEPRQPVRPQGVIENPKISFRAKVMLSAAATRYAKNEGYRGAGSVARKALIGFLVTEGYISADQRRQLAE